jgi:hypothetical protein
MSLKVELVSFFLLLFAALMTINYQIENNNAKRLFIQTDQNKPKYMKLILIGYKSYKVKLYIRTNARPNECIYV